MELIDGTMLSPPNRAKANESGVGLIFKDSGQTPAYKVVSWAQIAVEPPSNETALTVPVLQEHFVNNIGPGGTMPKFVWHGRQLNPSEIRRIEYRLIFDLRMPANSHRPPARVST